MILILCDYPTKSEIHETGLGRGPVWNLTFDELRLQGIDRSDVKILYLTKRCLDDKQFDKIYSDAVLKKPKTGCVSWKGLWVPEFIKIGWDQIESQLKDYDSPNGVLCMGDFCLHALTGKFSISRYRGAYLESFPKGKMIFPTYSPSTVMGMFTLHLALKKDIRVFSNTYHHPEIAERDFTYTIINSLKKLQDVLPTLSSSTTICLDIEVYQKKISVFGFTCDGKHAYVVTFCQVTQDKEGYKTKNIFSIEEEIEIILLLRDLLQRMKVIQGQNLSFDLQYLFREWLFFISKTQVIEDSLVMAHVLNPTMQKSLDYLASYYLPKYRQWKEDKMIPRLGKLSEYAGDERLWDYNASDSINTFRIIEVEKPLLVEQNLWDVHLQQSYSFHALLRMMCGGNRIDFKVRDQICGDIETRLVQYREYIKYVTGLDLNPKSPAQLNQYFYKDLKLHEQKKRTKPYNVSTDFDCLEALAKVEPIVAPLCKRINAIRSLMNLHSMAQMTLSLDGRAHTTYNPAGTDTYRLSSSESAIDEGSNLQNITKGDEQPKKVFEWSPNLRKMFIPEPGWTMFEGDLAGADAQVVAWEADDSLMKQAFLDRVDLHLFNANSIYNLGLPYERIKKSHPECKALAKQYDRQRQWAKAGVHATNYDVSPKTLAGTMEVTVRAAENFQRVWFELHPNIKLWQQRRRAELGRTRSIRNAFGYRYYWSDHLDFHAEKTVLAWSPQSTVAIVTQKIMIAFNELPYEYFRLNLQVHDSLLFQIRNDMIPTVLPKLKELSRIPIPYHNDTLIIPFEIVEKVSWGEDAKLN